jgi:hypothetical protein
MVGNGGRKIVGGMIFGTTFGKPRKRKNEHVGIM